MQQRLTKANVGLNTGNRAGHLPTVLQRYWKVPALVFMTLQNIFLHLHLRHNKLYKNTDKIKFTAHLGGVFLFACITLSLTVLFMLCGRLLFYQVYFHLFDDFRNATTNARRVYHVIAVRGLGGS